MQLEALLAGGPSPARETVAPYQFNSDFILSRPGGIGLVAEYLRQALRPTVAFPHVVLLALAACQLLT